ncbi:hypothetical protein NBRC116492_29730 [Aurantivibrio infirmus]
MKINLFLFIYVMCFTASSKAIDIESAIAQANSVSNCKFELDEATKIVDCNDNDLSIIEKGASCSKIYVKSEPASKMYLLFQKKESEIKYIIRVVEQKLGENIYITSGCPF